VRLFNLRQHFQHTWVILQHHFVLNQPHLDLVYADIDSLQHIVVAILVKKNLLLGSCLDLFNVHLEVAIT